ncbi:PREDICTED: uncharacterized protein LOC105563891 isoform X2 [Vollenhovia emeryi]|uniref:uncharacterized protein LOC105563891 isoform X2 n=1 Tax=Vollenhovia emeryi TaxID=411798 RepID=UPI0005F4FFCC|nr:PREDICTED: uncharacterized protein LOC105563891 isoform X2 [Vollenhovia emeryi]
MSIRHRFDIDRQVISRWYNCRNHDYIKDTIIIIFVIMPCSYIPLQINKTRCKSSLSKTSVIPDYVERCSSSETMNGVIWSRTQKTFVPISSVPEFAMMQQERLRQSRALETHNFQLQNVTLTYLQEPPFLEFYDEDTKITGLCGELWNLLSEKLNFTLQLVRSNKTLYVFEKNQSALKHGLLSIIMRNETNVIPKVNFANPLRVAFDFTTPLWTNSQRLYTAHEIVHDSTWMAKVFSWKIWCFVLIMYLLLSVCSFWSQTILARIRNNCRRSTIGDHIFYNFGMICNQNSIPNVLVGRSRILEISLGLFCSILYMAFGALLFVYMTKNISFLPPFNDLDSLRTKTSYKVVSLKGSIGEVVFTIMPQQHFVLLKTAQRVVIASTDEEMFKLACLKGEKKYVVFQGEDEFRTKGRIVCHVIPVGQPYLKMWMSSGIARNFKYKRSIDIGILRIKEVGLWNVLMDRWLIEKNQDNMNVSYAIEINQVIFIILIMCCGTIIAFIILIIEKIVYAYKLS